MQDTTTISMETPAPHVLRITLNRPEALNAINTQMGQDLLSVFDGLCAAPAMYRAVILTAAGTRAFCAGGDLKERSGMTDQAWQAQHLVFERAARAVLACPIPIIAAVNGVAFGGGCELVLLCDFAYAAATARFALPEVTLGIMPGMGGTQNLARAAGGRRAKEAALTGTPFDASEAFDWGVVNRVCDPETLQDAVLATASRIAGNAPLAVRQIKQSVQTGLQLDLTSGMQLEIEAYNRLVPTQDRLEGVLAFNEKRRPDFQGR